MDSEIGIVALAKLEVLVARERLLYLGLGAAPLIASQQACRGIFEGSGEAVSLKLIINRSRIRGYSQVFYSRLVE